MSFLTLERVAKTYPDGTAAVHQVDLTINEGEFIVLLGPSGCGKTTTLRMVAGLELATGGVIRLAGDDVTAKRPSERDVGFVFQFYALYPHLTVRDNLAFPLQAIGVGRIERATRIAEVAAAVGITGMLHEYPRQLSGGDQQRVSLARAMIRRPRLWLMDEPLGTLDADQRQQLGAFIKAQQQRHRVTTLFVTHDQEEAMHLADRIVVMEAGRVVQVGTPTDVYEQPATRFAAHFVGSPGMNLIRGVITDGIFRSGEFALPVPRSTVSETPVRNGAVELGIRPEYLSLVALGSGELGAPVEPGAPVGPVAPAETGATHACTGTVLLDEFLGDIRLVHVQVGDVRLVVRTAAHQHHAPGSLVKVTCAPSGIRLFDVQTGERW